MPLTNAMYSLVIDCVIWKKKKTFICKCEEEYGWENVTTLISTADSALSIYLDNDTKKALYVYYIVHQLMDGWMDGS